ncbi:NAD-glutamate dehydrogenase domain-containing protein [Chromobacterium piscinae]|uniref:NAD-glutamate dehydrogenase n=1 Tax=Chromobacterium piscinae TaxID=686831 RepID=A0ABV0HCX4_9NEIS|nr:NAD-glutamate dehydrogenase [Chromobacterium vaccinii]MBX9348062.1 NAD-glutamate dehydrogenase [Chromobacterium vaccinii]MBX9358321.1 NAD-glutamate dehydrogenase [Chromobacterium vaccinii]NHQ84306.1 NAD-glutamate dehydrogenase [Chromobacterium vaccinii]
MSLTNKTELASLIADIQAVAESKLSSKETQRLAAFFPIYFEETEHADLRQFSSLDLFGAAMAHYEFAGKRSAGQVKCRIYNPDFERDGWQSTHTVIEVVNDDMPFLIDSISMLLSRYNLNLHLLVHPVLAVARDKSGVLAEVKRTEDRSLPLESFIHVQIDRISDAELLAKLEAELKRVLADIRLVVSDEPKMREVLAGIGKDLAKVKGERAAEAKEAVAFLDWMAARNFLFMGYCDYDLVKRDGKDSLKIVKESGLGILKEQGDKEYSASFEQLPQELRELAHLPQLIILNKSQTRSIIHRPAYVDFVGIKRFNDKGQVIGERRFLGLYTASAYQASPKDVPILRQKVATVVSSCDFVDDSYKSKTLGFVLESYPRDELFEIPAEVLGPIAEGIVSLQERPRVRLFVRADRYHRYVSSLVYVPRDSFSTEVRLKIEKVLMNAFNGASAEFSVQIGDGTLARVHYIIRTASAKLPEFHAADIEAEIARLVRGWSEELHQQLVEAHGEERGNGLFNRYKDGFPLAYREEFAVRNAVLDVQHLEAICPEQPLAMKLYRPFHRVGAAFNLKLFREGEPLGLSASLPILENMGVKVRDEHPYCVKRADGSQVWISDFGLDVGGFGEQMAQDQVQQDFQELLAQVFAKRCENDGFNRLALVAGLDWREISLVRALAKYLRQGGLTFSQAYIEQCVANYPAITRSLVELFYARLDPAGFDDDKAELLLAAVRGMLDGVANLDEDRILNGFLAVILATRRTNFWQKAEDGHFKSYISFKLESNQIPFLPQPRPMFEIWVYSPRVEGVHLRGSKVARGGLRWSDRMEDFRTEVLGLVKAQMVKNSVIVPMGSKGGFVGKQLPAPSEREAFLAEGIACYKIFISALLDVTDNLVTGQIIPPTDVRRLDPDDPYLVVAADKGTATFSDIANGISESYGFWLGDAFASGGSAGYDHKGMGITARGAWESVKRHFRHLGVNTQEQDFTVIGIGDMAGDVFGNGMLLSEHICLKAAFNHLHIFLDPTPNAKKSFAERARLFNLPRSSWTDYNRELISKGGGIFERSAKSIPLSPEVKAWLETSKDSMAPNELIHEILKAKIDLLYNGGIGTYVKASTQSHADARDRACDPVRVNGNQLQARVVAEGGNLTCTQLGRVEFALAGGRIATDAIDNSAGVDCSDHEVNIKILLGAVMQAGDMTLKQRNELLAEMTDEVGHLVLRNNVLQTQVLAIKRLEAASMLSTHARMIAHMEKTGELNREIEYLPSETQINERRLARQGLTVPEIAVLLAYSKISLDQAILATDVPDDKDFLPILVNYFPKPLQQRFGKQMEQHQLRREIIANQLANQIINRMGTTFVFRMQEESPFSAADIARAWWIASRVFDAESLWGQIEALDNKVPADQQMQLMVLVRTLVERVTRWVLRNKRPFGSVNAVIEQYASKVQGLLAQLPKLIPAADYPAVAALEQRIAHANLPQPLTQVLARLEFAVPLMDIIEISEGSKLKLEQVAANYYQLGSTLQLDWLRDAITGLPRDNRWQSLARSALRDDLYSVHRNLARQALEGVSAADFAAKWLVNRQGAVEICGQMFAELQSFSALDLAMLSAGMRELNNHLLA